jgi:predicted PurR-regulated permease PerM
VLECGEKMAQSTQSSEEYVVVERKVSATAVILVMLMVMVFLSVAINFYYWQQIQDLNNNIKLLTQQLKSMQRDIQDLNQGLESYKAINALLELQMRSIVIKTLKDMGFSDTEIQQFLEKWYNMTKTSGS